MLLPLLHRGVKCLSTLPGQVALAIPPLPLVRQICVRWIHRRWPRVGSIVTLVIKQLVEYKNIIVVTSKVIPWII